jgi:hypothetical protein
MKFILDFFFSAIEGNRKYCNCQSYIFLCYDLIRNIMNFRTIIYIPFNAQDIHLACLLQVEGI